MTTVTSAHAVLIFNMFNPELRRLGQHASAAHRQSLVQFDPFVLRPVSEFEVSLELEKKHPGEWQYSKVLWQDGGPAAVAE